MTENHTTKPTRITPRLRRVLLALHLYTEQHNQGPTVRELAQALDQSQGATERSLRMLLEQDFVTRTRAVRDIVLTEKGHRVVKEAHRMPRRMPTAPPNASDPKPER